MNGRYVIIIIALVITSLFMSCSKSTTAPEEQKMYLFKAVGSEPIVPPATQPKILPIEMTKNADGIWQATVIVPAVPSPSTAYYSALFSDYPECRTGAVIYGDTAVPPAPLLQITLRTRVVPFPAINKSIKKTTVTTVSPRLNAIRIGNTLGSTGGPITRPDTVVFSLDPANMTFSVQ